MGGERQISSLGHRSPWRLSCGCCASPRPPPPAAPLIGQFESPATSCLSDCRAGGLGSAQTSSPLGGNLASQLHLHLNRKFSWPEAAYGVFTQLFVKVWAQMCAGNSRFSLRLEKYRARGWPRPGLLVTNGPSVLCRSRAWRKAAANHSWNYDPCLECQP